MPLPRHIAHDLVARNRVAALGAGQHDVVDAAGHQRQLSLLRLGDFDPVCRRKFLHRAAQPRDHAVNGEHAQPDFGEHIGAGLTGVDPFGDLVELLLAKVHLRVQAEEPQLLLQGFPSTMGVLVLCQLPEMGAQLAARVGRFHELQPVHAWGGIGTCDELDDVAVLEDGVQGHHQAVHFRAHQRHSQMGVNSEREVHGRAVLRQVDDIALRREDERLLRKQVGRDRPQEVA